MKKILLLMLPMMLLFIFDSCQKEDPLVVDIDYTGNLVAGETIRFRSVNTNATYFYWNFGDGTTKEGGYHDHVYSNPGTYTVQLTMENFKGTQATTSIEVTIQPADPCNSITCFNGGTCVNGVCNCPPGYTGSDCSVVLTPSSVTITSALVTQYPSTKPSGSGWDLTTGPDCFLTINSGTSSNQNSFVSGFTYTNHSGGNMPFNTGFPYTIATPSLNWVFGLWDADSPDPDDFMTGVYARLNDLNSGFPPTVTLTTSEFSITLYVTWNF